VTSASKLFVGGVLSAAFLTAGCGGTTPTGPTPSVAPSSVYPQAIGASAAPTADTLIIRSFAFSDLAVRAGAMVTVRNDDSVSHTVTSRQKGLFDVMTPPNSTTMFAAPPTPGRYPLYCKYHSNMSGFLTVT
jgi:plastocyanin